MQLDHEFTIPVPVSEAWPVLTDWARVAACMPGATLDEVGDGQHRGAVSPSLSVTGV